MLFQGFRYVLIYMQLLMAFPGPLRYTLCFGIRAERGFQNITLPLLEKEALYA